VIKLKKNVLGPHLRNCVYTYEIDENLILNEGDVREINQRITDSMGSTWAEVKNSISHFFQGSGPNSSNTITAAAGGFYAAGAAGALAGATIERTYACVNCHLGEPASQALSNAVDFITAPSDSTGN